MKALTFQRQFILGIFLMVIGYILAIVFDKDLFSNLAWILYGLLFLLHPVCPKCCDNKKGRWVVRIVGILCIAIGL